MWYICGRNVRFYKLNVFYVRVLIDIIIESKVFSCLLWILLSSYEVYMLQVLLHLQYSQGIDCELFIGGRCFIGVIDQLFPLIICAMTLSPYTCTLTQSDCIKKKSF
jgi:hypothetical protein